jgi:hypothetical protein
VTTKERLHQLVDELSESEADDALRYVASRREDPLIRRLDSAPLEDEEISPEEEAAAAEGRADIAAGRTISHEELLRELEDKPGDIIDEWGNLSAMRRADSARKLARLDEQEIAEHGETIADAWRYENPNETR